MYSVCQQSVLELNRSGGKAKAVGADPIGPEAEGDSMYTTDLFGISWFVALSSKQNIHEVLVEVGH